MVKKKNNNKKNVALDSKGPDSSGRVAYSFLPDTGEYAGEVVRQSSPLEFGVYLIPANATSVAPPVPVEGKYRRWTGTEWEYAEISTPKHEGDNLVPISDTGS